MKICPLCDVGYPDTHSRCPQDGALLLESRELAPGHVVRGKYKIVKKIGQGGMGTVYHAEDTFMNVQVALKFLSGELSSDPTFTRRFRDEARTAFRLRHTNIVEVNGLDQSDDGNLFIAMEYVDGLSLRALLDKAAGPLLVPRAIHLARGIASGLGAAHNSGFVHRDVKPENIVVRRQGDVEEPKILDFGIVAVMEKAQAADTPSQRLSRGPILTAEYAAPEQWAFAKPEDLDGRTDMYSLGCVFYEMLTGRLPFSAKSYEGWMDQHLKAMPLPPSAYSPEISRYRGLDELLLRMLNKRLDARPDVKQFLTALDAIPKEPAAIPRAAVAPSMTVMEQVAPRAPRASTVQQDVSEPKPSGRLAVEPKHGSSRAPIWIAGAAALLIAVGLGGYEIKHKDSAGTDPKPVPTDTDKKDTPVPITPVPVIKTTKIVPNSGGAGHTATGDPQPEPPPGKKPDAAPETPAAMEKRASTFYAARNYAQAGPLYQSACEQNSSESCRMLADMYAKEEGFAKDPAKVVELRQKSCDLGDMVACNQLSFNYFNGEGVAKDKMKVETLRTRACDGGYAEACTRLGALYLSEAGFKDQQKAAQYFQKGCDEKSREGCWYIAKMYEVGIGVPKDLQKSKALYTESCQMGYAKSCDALQSQMF